MGREGNDYDRMSRVWQRCSGTDGELINYYDRDAASMEDMRWLAGRW